MVGGWPRVHAVFQKMLEKRRATWPGGGADAGGRQGRAEGVGGADGAVVEPDARLPVGAFEGEHEGFVRPGGGTVNSR